MDESPILSIPNEMIAFILNKLELPQLIKCRLISKRFKFIIHNHQRYNIKKEKLIIFSPYNLSRERDNSILVDSRDSFDLDECKEGLKSIFSSNFFNKFYLNLKELYFNCREFNFNLEMLNQFSKLEILHFDTFFSEKNQTINLPNLKSFAILFNSSYHDLQEQTNKKIIIESKLERVELNMYQNKFKFKYPEYVNYFK